MFKLVAILALVTVCSSATAPLRTICKVVHDLDCALFAHHQQCGSDQVTYDNNCAFSKAHCSNTNIHIIHNGTCTGQTGPVGTPGGSAVHTFFCQQMVQQQCGLDVEHLCGSDGVNYNNFCYYEKARCHDVTLYIASYHPCSH